MRNLPVNLQPVERVNVPLPSGSSATLPVSRPSFRRWRGAPVFQYGNKPLLDCDGEACFAELLILRLLLKSGWSGIWVETYGGVHYLRTMPSGWGLRSEHVSIPSDKHELLQQIQRAAKTPSCFDVFVWRGDQLLFCEAKWRNDKLTKPQFRFIEGALACGIPRQALMLVEWSEAA
jgi:hypothetical protein